MSLQSIHCCGQDHCANQQKTKRALDAQVRELEIRLADVVETATKGGKNAIAKLEGRVKDLEMELGNCQMRTAETQKSYQKSERKIKELQFQTDEDQKNQEKMGELATKLQEKIRTYKKQIEEAEEIAALNLAKFRKAQQELEECEERSRQGRISFRKCKGKIGVLMKIFGSNLSVFHKMPIFRFKIH